MCIEEYFKEKQIDQSEIKLTIGEILKLNYDLKILSLSNYHQNQYSIYFDCLISLFHRKF